MRVFMMILILFLFSPSVFSDEAAFRSALKLRVHQQVEEIRNNKNEIIHYLLESNVRKVKMDFFLAFRKKGLTYQEIDELFMSKEYKDLFERVRNNPKLKQRAKDFVKRLTQPHYLEERIILHHIELAKTYKEYQQEEYQKALLELQATIRRIKTKKEEPKGFWVQLRHNILTFLGVPV